MLGNEPSTTTTSLMHEGPLVALRDSVRGFSFVVVLVSLLFLFSFSFYLFPSCPLLSTLPCSYSGSISKCPSILGLLSFWPHFWPVNFAVLPFVGGQYRLAWVSSSFALYFLVVALD